MIMDGHNGRHLDRDETCEECLGFRLKWTAMAERNHVLSGVVATLLRIAGEHFQSGCDGLAQELRRIAKTEFGKQKDEASRALQAFIDASAKE